MTDPRPLSEILDRITPCYRCGQLLDRDGDAHDIPFPNEEGLAWYCPRCCPQCRRGQS